MLAAQDPQVDEIELIRDLCKNSFYFFVQEMWDTIIAETPQWNWHIRYLCNQLQKMAERVFRGEIKEYDLCVNISPGTTKSTIMSVLFPIWCWTRMPSFRFIGASHSMPLAQDLSMKSRDVVLSEKFQLLFPEIQLREDQSTKSYFKNTKGGYRYAVGVNGSVIGMHAHFIVIDDPLDPMKALSAADIKTTNHWIVHALSTRKVNKAVTPMALVMQRIHQDDPTYTFLKGKKKKVKHICLPAELTEKVNPPGLKKYYVKGLMDPNRLSKAVLKEEKLKGTLYYATQFLQEPIPAEGGMFDVRKIKWGRLPEKWKKLVRFWDKAGTKGGGAYTVGTLMGLDFEDRVWVIDVVRKQLDSAERDKLIKYTARQDGHSVLIVMEQEPGSGGKQSAQSSVQGLQGYRIKFQKVGISTGDKEQRADPFSAQVNLGNVYIPNALRDEQGEGENKWIGWAREWMDEFKHFPHSRYMDQVDSASGAYSMIFQRVIRVGGLKSRYEHEESLGGHVTKKIDISVKTRRRVEKMLTNRKKFKMRVYSG